MTLMIKPKAQHATRVLAERETEKVTVNIERKDVRQREICPRDHFAAEKDPTCYDCISAGLQGRWDCSLPPRIGAYDDWGWSMVGNAHGFIEKDHERQRVQQEFSTVEPWWCLRNAVHDVPTQENGWACGINGSARFLAMLGKPVANYESYHNEAPTYASLHTEIGPAPSRLFAYMRKDGHLEGIDVRVDKTDDWESQKSIIDESLRLHRPVLVLFEVCDRMLHYANIVGRQWNHPYDYLILNSNDRFYKMSEATLRQRMNISRHIAQSPFSTFNPIVSFEPLGDFNSISCTGGHLPPGHGDIRTFGGHGAQLRGNRNAAHNIVNTVLDSPVMQVTPLAWLWRIF